jgi:hypothetical protein
VGGGNVMKAIVGAALALSIFVGLPIVVGLIT